MIQHILKDGRMLQDITGHQVTRKDNPRVYEILDRANERRKSEGRVQKGKE